MYPVELRELPDWERWEAAGVDVSGYLAGRLSLGTLAQASRIFWPRFVEREGLVLLADGLTDETIARWRAHVGDDPARLEGILNQRRLPGLVPDSDPPLSGAALVQLGELLRQLWQHAVDAQVERACCVRGRWAPADDEYTLTVSRAPSPSLPGAD